MIRFRCSPCGKMLKAPADTAGRPVICPRCGEQSVVPAEEAAAGGSPAAQLQAVDSDPAPGLFAGMSPAVRRSASLLAGVGALGLLLAVLRLLLPGLGGSALSWAGLVALGSFLLLGVILHGQGTGCPWCGAWWSRGRVEKAFVDREVFETREGPFRRSLYKTTYVCEECGRRWSVSETDVYPERARRTPQRSGR